MVLITEHKSPEAWRAWVLAVGSDAMAAAGIAPTRIGTVASLEAAPAIAHVNEGRWIANCPAAECAAALVLHESAPFLCPLCLNAAAGYMPRRVEWPAEAAEIEAALVLRPLAITRNWVPGEPVADLLAENVRKGVTA